MKAISVILIYIAFASLASATMVEQKPLKELVLLSSNIWGGEVTAVRMTNAKGKDIKNLEARTGPGLENTIYLDVTINKSLILKTNKSDIPTIISIPLWQMWHYSLGQIREIVGSKSIFLLTEDLKPAYPANFQRSLDE